MPQLKETFQDFTWLVVGDLEGYSLPARAVVLDAPGDLCSNWLTALDWLEANQAERVVVMEDDDWYAPEYVEVMFSLPAELVGLKRDLYFYLLSRKPRRLHNFNFSSLATTGFARSVFPSGRLPLPRVGRPAGGRQGSARSTPIARCQGLV
jgi:hypothetical protein